MRKKILKRKKREFVLLSCEAKRGETATEEMQDIFRRLDEELCRMGLSLANTIRTRLWGIDRESRDMGSSVRAAHNTGKARAATSSYISPVPPMEIVLVDGYSAEGKLIEIEVTAELK